jgi:hypothetical protein
MRVYLEVHIKVTRKSCSNLVVGRNAKKPRPCLSSRSLANAVPHLASLLPCSPIVSVINHTKETHKAGGSSKRFVSSSSSCCPHARLSGLDTVPFNWLSNQPEGRSLLASQHTRTSLIPTPFPTQHTGWRRHAAPISQPSVFSSPRRWVRPDLFVRRPAHSSYQKERGPCPSSSVQSRRLCSSR